MAIRDLPHNVEAEKIILGSMLLEPDESIPTAEGIISAEDFYSMPHRKIYRAIMHQFYAGRAADVVGVRQYLEDTGDLERVGGSLYMNELLDAITTTATLQHYIQIIVSQSQKRKLISAGVQLEELGYHSDGDVAQMQEKAMHTINEAIFDEGVANEIRPISELETEFMERIAAEKETGRPSNYLTTGFKTLDERVFDLRGQLMFIAGSSSMGKCIASGSRVLDPLTGRLEIIDDLVAHQKGTIATIDSHLSLQATAPSHFLDDGIKPAFRVRTALGREITTTITHPFLTLRGWKKLGELGVGQRIGIPRTLPFFGNNNLSERRVKLIAYLITDGGLTQNTPQFTNSNTRIMDDFIETLNDFPGVVFRADRFRGDAIFQGHISTDPVFLRQARQEFANKLRQRLDELSLPQRTLAHKLEVSPASVCLWVAGKCVPKADTFDALCKEIEVDSQALMPYGRAATASTAPNAVTEWMSSLGMMGKSAHEKRVPECIFELPRERMAVFINRAFSCDGSAFIQNGTQAELSYGTVSFGLAQDMQHLLLRFGIIAKLRRRMIKYKGEYRRAYELIITHQEHKQRFLKEIGMYGKEEAVRKALLMSQSKNPKVVLDTVPREVWELIAERKGQMTWAELAQRMGRKKGYHFNVGTRGTGRKYLAEIANALQDDTLINLANSDLYWDKIESIDYIGKKRVYDLSVPETHNFIAEDMLVHNSMHMLNMAYKQARKGIKVGVISLEMTDVAIMNRILIRHMGVSAKDRKYKPIEDIRKSLGAVLTLPMWLVSLGTSSLIGILREMRQMVLQHGIQCIYVDYIQLIGDISSSQRVNELEEISRQLLLFTKKYNVGVVVGSQFSREVMGTGDKRPKLWMLRGSGGIENNSDIVIGLFRKDYIDKTESDGFHSAGKEMEIHWLKNRNDGEAGMVDKMLYWLDKQTVEDMTYASEEAF